MNTALIPQTMPGPAFGSDQKSLSPFSNSAPDDTADSGHLQTLIDHVDIGLFTLHENSLSFVNRAFIRYLGCQNAAELQGRPFLLLLHPNDRTRFTDHMRNPTPVVGESSVPFHICTDDGRILRAHLGIKPLSGQPGNRHIGYLCEVTADMNRQNELDTALNKYKMIVDDVEDVLAEVDLQGNILSVNNNANLKIWGVPQEQAIGTNYRCYVDEKNRRIVSQAYRQIYQTGRPGKVTYEIIRLDGQKRFVEDSASLITDAGGKPAGFRVVCRDVTERKEAEKKLAEHRMCLETIFASVKDAIITVDTQMRVIEINKSTETICGIYVAKSRGRNLSDCLVHCNHACCDVIKMTLENKTAVKDYRINCSHIGRQQAVSISSSPLLNPEGSFLGAVLVIRDITLLKNMENELRERHQFQNIVGQNKKMKAVYSLIESLTDLDTTVLITGESGTGKELVARALHYGGRRAFKPFVAVNCSALSESLLESELFGHVKGAFTGATREREGRFEAANGGTILLDEIGDLSPLIQLKLLRVLQEKVYERVGDSRQRKADVRIITSTNRDLKEKVRRGELREDLYYRLKVIEIALPPLRERPEDIPLLIGHFLKIFNDKFNKQVAGVDPAVLSAFMKYSWPGNVREFEHIMEHAFILCRSDAMTMDDLPPEFRESVRSAHMPGLRTPAKAENDSETIYNALIETRGNKARAARLLGISRQTIYRKIYQYHLLEKL